MKIEDIRKEMGNTENLGEGRRREDRHELVDNLVQSSNYIYN